MKRYFCNGKKGYCDRGNDDKIDCTACEFADGRGGETVDCPDTNYERIKTMSIDEMATTIYNGVSSDPCDYCKHNNFHCLGKPCKDKANVDVIAEWLESEVEEE